MLAGAGAGEAAFPAGEPAVTSLLTELGARLQRQRLDRNITQAWLATEAGISLPTLQRLEAGASVQLTSLLRVLRALNLLGNLDALVPAPTIQPMALLRRKGRRRQRASSDHAATGDPQSGHPPDDATRPDRPPWTWGE